VDPRASLDDVEKRKFLALPEREPRPLGRPAHSQSLYRLRYPGSIFICGVQLFLSWDEFEDFYIYIYIEDVHIDQLSQICPSELLTPPLPIWLIS
jgi:hypothetical protein